MKNRYIAIGIAFILTGAVIYIASGNSTKEHSKNERAEINSKNPPQNRSITKNPLRVENKPPNIDSVREGIREYKNTGLRYVSRNFAGGEIKDDPMDLFPQYEKVNLEANKLKLVKGLRASYVKPEGTEEFKKLNGFFFYPEELSNSPGQEVIYNEDLKKYGVWTKEFKVYGSNEAIQAVKTTFGAQILRIAEGMATFKVGDDFFLQKDFNKIPKIDGVKEVKLDINYSRKVRL